MTKTTITRVTLFTLLLACILPTAVTAAEQGKFDIENARAPLFTCPIFDGIADPAVVWNKERNEWWILYTQRRANQNLQPGVPYAYGTAIGIAASKNNGRTWYYKGTLDLPQPDKGHNTFWAPQVFKDGDTYHLIVTYIEGVHNNWGGIAYLTHYKSDDLLNWEFVSRIEGSEDCIDGAVIQMPDKTWKMWYKTPGGKTAVATSTDLKKWTLTKKIEINDSNHEAPIVFQWKDKYWMLTDPCDLRYVGLRIYESDDAVTWKLNNNLLNTPGKRRDDNDQGRHPDVAIVDGRAYIFYFTHPGREYNDKGVEIRKNTHEFRRSSLQVAELELVDGKVICDRDKYARK